MSREEYMKQLSFLLQDIPENEREEALPIMRITLRRPERVRSGRLPQHLEAPRRWLP